MPHHLFKKTKLHLAKNYTLSENHLLLDYIIFHHFHSIRNHSHSIRNHSHSLVKSHRYDLSMFVEDINFLFEKIWNKFYFFF